MTITLEISHETELELTRQAAANGLAVSAYAANLLQAASTSTRRPLQPKESAKDLVELFAPLRGLNLDFERDRDPGRDIDL